MTAPASPFLFVDDPGAFEAEGALVVRIPAGARGKEKLLGVLARKLRFPGYFGHNWDALDECLRDLSWLDRRGRVVIVHEGLPFSPSSPSLVTYLGILADAVAAHRPVGLPPILDVVFPAADGAAFGARNA
ncbi:MAG: hypothetical protein EBR86_10010 [Planctomycetia bacterium]|nr:hypothetical protein [Planctomycetia bacterium]